VSIGSARFGGGSFPVIAGPCSVEPDYVAHARAAADAGADVLRGCVFKPRSRPDRFQGIGVDGVPLPVEAPAATGLPVIAELIDATLQVNALSRSLTDRRTTPDAPER
jgi:3-deoxy-7-phosphoheptulonate synthase